MKHAIQLALLALSATAIAPEIEGQTITSSNNVRIVATDTVVRSQNEKLQIGWNVAWQKFQINFWNTSTQTADAQVVSTLKNSMPGMVYRYPGGTVSNYFNWTEAIGPVSSRSQQYTDNPGYLLPYFGVDEFLRFVEQVDGIPMLVVNMTVDDRTALTTDQIPEWAQKAADWVEYCNAPNDGSNPGGGTDWAAVRATNGHPAPYNVRVWELDNETDHRSLTAATYVDRCKLYIAAMRAIDPTIKIMAHAATSLEEKTGWENWHRTVLDGLGNTIDMVAGHPYYDGKQIPVKLGALQTIRDDSLSRVPNNTPRVAVTEHATWTDTKGTFSGRNSSIVGVIGTSDFLIGCAYRSYIERAVMHVLDGSGWWVAFQSAGNPAVRQPRPVTLSNALMREALQSGDILSATIYTPNNSAYNGGYDVRAAVIRRPDGSHVLAFSNRHAAAYTAQLEIAGLAAGNYDIARRYLSDPGDTSIDLNKFLAIESDTSVAGVTLNGGAGILTVNLPARSAGVIEITASSAPAGFALTSPLGGSTYVVGETISLAANTPESVDTVEFFVGSTSLGSDANAPFTGAWQPTAPGTYLLTAVGTGNAEPVTTMPVSITVVADSVPQITTTSLPDAEVGSIYLQTLGASGGNGVRVWSLSSGNLPPGIELDADGTLFGLGTTAGAYTFTLRVADSDGLTGPSDESTATYTITVGESAGNAVRIIAGSTESFIDSAGHAWLADTGFSGGGGIVDRGAIEIAGTEDDRIYQTEHYNMTAFNRPVLNGDYTVRLHFAETYALINAAGKRVFSIQIEGQSPSNLQNIDVFAEAGGFATALVKEVPVTVTDGSLDLSFIRITQSPTIDGIEIIPRPVLSAAPSDVNVLIEAGSLLITYPSAPYGRTFAVQGSPDLVEWTLIADSERTADAEALSWALPLSSLGADDRYFIRIVELTP